MRVNKLKMRVNKLSTNPKKTELMLIGHPPRNSKIKALAPLKLNGKEITRVKKTTSLEMIDETRISVGSNTSNHSRVK